MSPTVFREKGYRFFFFSREEQRPHVHVGGERGEAKFWLEPKVELVKNHGFNGIQLREIELIIEAHRDEIKSAWKAHFGS